jgi:rubrerythrin
MRRRIPLMLIQSDFAEKSEKSPEANPKTVEIVENSHMPARLGHVTGCPECGGPLAAASACVVCPACGWSRCG